MYRGHVYVCTCTYVQKYLVGVAPCHKCCCCCCYDSVPIRTNHNVIDGENNIRNRFSYQKKLTLKKAYNPNSLKKGHSFISVVLIGVDEVYLYYIIIELTLVVNPLLVLCTISQSHEEDNLCVHAESLSEK